MTRRPRGLKPEEEKLWQRIADSATPMHRRYQPQPKAPVKTPVKTPAPAPVEPPFSPPSFRIGETAAPRTENPAKSAGRPPRMDTRTFGRMKRGKVVPEARIDLHGMTLAAAQMSLTGFLLRAHADGKRLVLVITGKGRKPDDDDPVPQRRGVIRRHLPEWLSSPPLGALVLEWTTAHQRHGGSGAFYVYLSRRR